MWWRPSAVTAVMLAMAVGLVGNLATNTVQVSAGWWPPVVWAAVGLLVAIALVTEFARSRSPALESVSGVDEWAEGLAQGVQALWRREEEHRRVHDPVALPVRWHTATGDLADHWANVRRVPAGATAGPLTLAGRIEQLAEVYRRIPSGRLVILGQAGAGKTVLAARLTLDLLAARRSGQPVPVIVSAGSWNPTTTPLNVWLAEQLTRDHPGLATPVQKGGPTRAAALIEHGRVLPILDGFDEIDAGLHQAALRQLNTTPNTPIVITSRAAAYTTAVRGTDVLTAAAVVELDDLTLQDLAAYLPRTAAGHRTGIWDPVLERMRTEAHDSGPATLRQVLTNPLMVFLARTIYSDTPGHDPAQLLDTHQFPTAQALQDHLLAAFIPAVYQAGQPSSTRRRWPVGRAHRYLTYLARHLHKSGTRDLAWWQLRDTIPRPCRALIFALVDGLLSGLAVGLAYLLAYGTQSWGRLEVALPFGLATTLASGLTVALTAGLTRMLRSQRLPGKPRFLSSKVAIALVVGLVIGLAFVLGYMLTDVLLHDDADFSVVDLRYGLRYGLPFALAAGLAAGLIGLRSAGPQPTRTRLQIRGQAQFIAGRFVVGFVVGLVVVFVLWFVLGLAVGLSFGLTVELVVGFVGGLAFGLAAAVAFGLEAPVNAADVVRAADSLARDRRNTIRKMLAVWLAVGAVVGLEFGLAYGLNEPTVGLMDGLEVWLKYGLGAGFAAAVVVGFVSVRATSAWIYWLVLVRGWLPLTGHMPWRVQAFLTDAYQRGVLRQTGAVYQFRHARLQDHLTADTTTDRGTRSAQPSPTRRRHTELPTGNHSGQFL